MMTLFFIVIFLISVADGGRGYPTVAHANFHHNALLYVHQMYSSDQLSLWLTGGFQSINSRRVIFDAITILSQHTASGASTEYSTNKQDWTWFIEKKLAGPYGILANLSNALVGLDMSREKLQVIIMLPFVDLVGQANFSPELNLSLQTHRQRAIEWYVDRVVQELNLYPNLKLWGMYLMREDIIPGINEQVILETSQIVHARQLRLLWIPYASAINWKNWATLGIDVAILQPGYAFAAPLLQGTLNGGRLRATAKLAYQYGLGVEIETSQGASTEYETALLQDYLAEGGIDGYQQAPTAYFLGSYQTIAKSERACSLIQNYTAGMQIEPTFIWNTNWNWTRNSPMPLEATIAISPSSNIIPQGIRVNWSPNNSDWQGRVAVQGLVTTDSGHRWTLLSSVEVGETNWRDENWTSTLLPFSLDHTQIISSLRVIFVGLLPPHSLTNKDIIIERVPTTLAPQTSTGAPYRILPPMSSSSFPFSPQYGDSTNETLSNFGRGLLTDGQWSTGEWQSNMFIGWSDNTNHRRHTRIALDFGRVTRVDQIMIRSHGGTSAAINWPNVARAFVSSECVPFSAHSSSDCTVMSYPCTSRVITGGTETNQGGYLSFTLSTNLRWAILDLLPNGWLVLDEVQAFANDQDISNTLTYRLLSPPSQFPSSSVIDYMDDGIRLTDGLVAGMIGPITGWRKNEFRTIIIDLLVIRVIRQASVWTLNKPDWAIKSPTTVIVSTSLDEKTWTLLGGHGQLDMGEQIYEAQRLFITTSNPNQGRFVKFDFPNDQSAPGWWTMILELAATD